MNPRRICVLSAALAVGAFFVQPSHSAAVGLQEATSTWSQATGDREISWSPDKTIDGVERGYMTSWAIGRSFEYPNAETIVWETQSDLTLDGTSPLQFDLHHWDLNAAPGHGLGRFRLSYTTDSRSDFADGAIVNGDVTANWVVIVPAATHSTGGEVLTTLDDFSILVSGGSNLRPVYTVRSLLSVSGITGFRLEALKDDSLPHGGPGRHRDIGNFTLSEFVVTTAVPEPSPASLMFLGLAVLAVGRRLPCKHFATHGGVLSRWGKARGA